MVLGLLTGAFVSAVIGRVVTVASTHVEDHFKGRKGIGEELRRLKMLLPQIQSVVDQAESGEQQISGPLNEWLQQLKDALYEADDAVDELDYHQLKQRAEADAKSKAIKFAKHVFKSDPTLGKLRRVVKKLDEVAAGVGNFVALVSNAQREFQQQETQTILRRETGPLLTENKVFGRQNERDELLRWLMAADREDESNLDVSLFSVVGHGGMGKTTLAQLVYNDETIQESFDLKIWVCVSTFFDVRGLTRSILEHATGQKPNIDGLPALQDALKEKLKTSGKFILILDDVWNDDNSSNWDKLLAPLKYGRKGSKVLLTTRMDRVADMAAHAMGTPSKKSLKLGGLHGEDFSSLFNRYAFAGIDYENYQKLQCIGVQIAKRLGSSPLAAKTVGGLLNSKLDDRYWIDVLHSKNISDRAQQGEDNIMSILMLSYRQLPLHLRSCFAYCGMFPKDHEFNKGDLVLMWIALGLIHRSHQNQGEMLEDIGSYYFDELARRSLFDHKYNDSYIMHDLLHDLAQSVSHGECSNFVNNDKMVEENNPNTVRHLYIESGSLNLLTKLENWHNLRSLVLNINVGRSEYFSTLEKVFKSLKSIRVLNVDLNFFRKATMPDAFSHLIHLRNLKFENHLQQFPRSLCKLYHLQALQFPYKGGTISLPESMNKLVNLRHMSANHQVVGVGKLIFLQDLSFFVKKDRGYKIGELEDLVWLRSLRIEDLDNVKNQEEASMAKLYNKKYLESLYLGWSVSGDTVIDKYELVLDRLQPHSNLKNLMIKGYRGSRYANWMGFDQISNLQYIFLSNCSRLDHLPPLSRLPFLKEFKLKNMPAIKKLDYQCQHLKNLYIYDMEGLEEVSGSGVDVGQWHPHLHTLVIENCPKLEVMPSLSMSIRVIRLDNVGLVSLPTLWLDRSNMCSTNDSLSSSLLKKMKIINCGKMTSLGNYFLQHYLTALKALVIENCPELADLPSGGLQHLRALKKLRIINCPKLQVTPDRITPDENDEKFLSLSLQSLMIKGCTELARSLPALLKGFISLDELILWDCEELMLLEGLMGIQSIGRLVIGHLLIGRYPEPVHVTGTNTIGSDFTLAVSTLDIDNPVLLVSRVLKCLIQVDWLKIWELGGIEDLSTLEQWLLQNQTTLKTITIDRASSLKSLPDSLKELSSLNRLEIYDASETLRERCRKDEGADWPHISHIPNIYIKSISGSV